MYDRDKLFNAGLIGGFTVLGIAVARIANLGRDAALKADALSIVVLKNIEKFDGEDLEIIRVCTKHLHR